MNPAITESVFTVHQNLYEIQADSNTNFFDVWVGLTWPDSYK